MKEIISKIAERILNGGQIYYDEAVEIINIDEKDIETLDVLFKGANSIREKFAGRKVDLCTIMNVKSGRCSENCKFCAQSIYYNTGIMEYGLLDYDAILKRAKEMEQVGAHRFSLVTSGKGIKGKDFEKILDIYRRLSKDTNLKLCASLGIISYEQALKLKEAGVSMYHHNIETSREYYKKVCTTHSYEERIESIKNAMKAGLKICCGGIIGMGESREDRVKMAFEIRNLGIKSVPINVLNPIKGTPLENRKILSPFEILKTMALYRYIIPDSYIRYAGGRMALKNRQNMGFRAGVNAALVGDYLTTIGSNIEQDKKMIIQEGLDIEKGY
ncbi:biotin synthase [Caloranaerobacter azorensis DSM 13643]|uniref:Biotin synthase n=1 Tax=Caloranaerobacter azorensis DSM 13643 TaxID=1121264 RepID=A0A1M5SS83_9FIRM|nr:biotin synthase BioB [Caloranaerobacter azorensis]SHH41287.1 biotin synthase [Caloranaerobacter azorensis DSM 13643]